MECTLAMQARNRARARARNRNRTSRFIMRIPNQDHQPGGTLRDVRQRDVTGRTSVFQFPILYLYLLANSLPRTTARLTADGDNDSLLLKDDCVMPSAFVAQ